MSRKFRPALAAAAALAWMAPGAAAAVHVTDAGDTGAAGQLRQVVTAAPAGETVVIDAGVGPITLTQGAVSIDKTITIEGQGSAATTVGAGDASRVFLATAGSLTLRGMTIRDGAFTNPGNVFLGGGGCVANLGPGAVALDDVVVTECAVTGSSGGGVYLNGSGIVVTNSALTKSTVTNPGENAVGGGGIYANGGDVEVSDSDISENTVNVSHADPDAAGGGAISANGGDVIAIESSSLVGNDVTINGTGATHPGANGGGAINSQAFTVKVLDSVVNDNTVTLTGPAHTGDSGGGAIYLNGTDMEATDSTFAGNSVTQTTAANDVDGNGGGAIHGNGSRYTFSGVTISGNSVSFSTGGTGAENSGGGGLYSNGLQNTSQVVNSTLSGNTATLTPAPEDAGGGGWYINGTGGVLVNVTVAGNSTNGEAGGIFEPPALRNTILAANAAPTGKNCAFYGPGGSPHLPSEGHNLEDAATCGLAGPQDIIGQGAKLGALANNGGPTKTRLPDADSPAIDKGLNCPAGDQRGLARPFGAGCDIGSVERGATDPAPVPKPSADPPGPVQVCGPSGTVLPQCTGSPPPAPIVCGGSGTIVPPCFNRLPQPDPLIVCGASFGTILRSCDGLGLGIGGKPIGLDGQTFPVQVSCGRPGRARAALLKLPRDCLVKLDLKLDAKLTSPAAGLLRGIMPGFAQKLRDGTLNQMTAIMKQLSGAEAIMTEMQASAEDAVERLDPAAPAVETLNGQAAELAASAERVQRLQLQMGDLLTRPRGRFGGFLGQIGRTVNGTSADVLLRTGSLAELLKGITPSFADRMFRDLKANLLNAQTGLSTLRSMVSKARPETDEAAGEPRAHASAARGKARVARVLASVPIASRTVVVPYGKKVTVRLKARPWARKIIRRSKRIGVRYGAMVVSRGDAKSAARKVTIKRRKR